MSLALFIFVSHNKKYMTISYGYDQPKVLQALRYHFINKKDIRYILLAVNALAVISGVLYFLKKIEPNVFFLTSLMWIVLMLVFWILMPRIIYSRTKSFKENFITTINQDEVTLQSELGARTWPMQQFTNWFESPHFIHLYVAANSFFIIPKDPFTESQLTEVRVLFQKNIKRA